MISKNNLFFLFQIILILLSVPLSLSIISIPFKLNISNISKSYNSTDFYNFYLNRSIFLEMNIGTPSKKINATLNLKSSCFYFSKEHLNTNNYYPIKSSSFKLNGQSNIYTDLRNANDIIYFQDIKRNQKLSFLLMNDTDLNKINNNYIPIIGLDDPYVIYGRSFICPCPNIFHDLKQAKLIKKKIWTIKYNSKLNGEFILGGDLSEYDGEKYHDELYTKACYDPQYSIIFDSIYTEVDNRIKYINDNNSNKMNRKAFININSGVIIGTRDYKNYIDSNFFNNLIERKICQVDCVNDYIINFLLLFFDQKNWKIILYLKMKIYLNKY